MSTERTTCWKCRRPIANEAEEAAYPNTPNSGKLCWHGFLQIKYWRDVVDERKAALAEAEASLAKAQKQFGRGQ